MNNEVTDVEGYKDKMWEMLPNLEVLDGYNKAGEEILSDDSDIYGDEEGEADLEGDFIDDEQYQQDLANMRKQMLAQKEGGKPVFEFSYGEEGEEDMEEGEHEVSEEQNGDKK